MNFGGRVRIERERRDWTQEELATRAGNGVTQQDITAIERRDSKRSIHAPAIAKALDLSLEYLLTGVDDESRLLPSPRSLEAKLARNPVHLVPRLDVRAGMGNGVMIRDVVEIIEHVGLNVAEMCRVRGVSITSPANLRIITGYGPSMRPTFDHLDQLLVDTGVNDLKIDDVYCLEDDEDLYIKRLQRIPGKKNSYMMISDNKDFQSFAIEDPLRSGFRVHGRVVVALKLVKV